MGGATCPSWTPLAAPLSSGTARRSQILQILCDGRFYVTGGLMICDKQILRDGFDSRLDPIAFEIGLQYIPGGCWLEKRKLTSQSPSITLQYSFVITSPYLSVSSISWYWLAGSDVLARSRDSASIFVPATMTSQSKQRSGELTQ